MRTALRTFAVETQATLAPTADHALVARLATTACWTSCALIACVNDLRIALTLSVPAARVARILRRRLATLPPAAVNDVVLVLVVDTKPALGPLAMNVLATRLSRTGRLSDCPVRLASTECALVAEDPEDADLTNGGGALTKDAADALAAEYVLRAALISEARFELAAARVLLVALAVTGTFGLPADRATCARLVRSETPGEDAANEMSLALIVASVAEALLVAASVLASFLDNVAALGPAAARVASAVLESTALLDPAAVFADCARLTSRTRLALAVTKEIRRALIVVSVATAAFDVVSAFAPALVIVAKFGDEAD